MLMALACATVPGKVAGTVQNCVNLNIDFRPSGLAGSLPPLQTEPRALIGPNPLLFLLPCARTDPRWQALRAMQHALVAVAPLTRAR
jgi:hypothetical protein